MPSKILHVGRMKGKAYVGEIYPDTCESEHYDSFPSGLSKCRVTALFQARNDRFYPQGWSVLSALLLLIPTGHLVKQNPSFRKKQANKRPTSQCNYLRNAVLQAGRALSAGGGGGHGGGGLHYGGGHVCRCRRGG